MTTIDEFARDFVMDVRLAADASESLLEDAFFQQFTDLVVSSGSLMTAERAYHRNASGSERIDGYGGDPSQNNGSLDLIITDFHNAPEVGRIVKTEVDDILKRPQRFLKRALDEKWRNALEETSPAFGLADLVSARWKSIHRIHVFLLTNRELSARVDAVDAEPFEDRSVSVSIWDLKRLHRFVMSGREAEDIDFDLAADYGGSIPILAAHLPSGGYQSYLAVMPGETLARIYDRWSARLLEQNVRVFLQVRGNVNKGIRKTIEEEPDMFFAYNNGITATATEIEIQNDDRGQPTLCRIKNLQIVNGGQTTASIHAAHFAKKDVSRVFVQMKLSIVEPERSREVVPKISEYANSQNRVNAADFSANHPYHVRMQDFSRRLWAPPKDNATVDTRWFYERSRGQHADAKSRLKPSEKRKFDLEHPRDQVFSKTDLAKYLAVWEGLPHLVSLGAQKNFGEFAGRLRKAWSADDTRFNEAHFKEIVAKAIIFRATERIVSKASWYQNGYRANIVAYGIAKIAHEVEASGLAFDFESVWRRQDIVAVTRTEIDRASELAQSVILKPGEGMRNLSEWAKRQACWHTVKSTPFKLSEDFVDQLVAVEDVAMEKASARREQRVHSGVEAQSKVVERGAAYWIELLTRARKERGLSPTDMGVLEVASSMPRRIPTEKQAKRLLEIEERMAAR